MTYDSATEYETGWSYNDDTSRLERVTGPGLPGGGTEPGVKYSFLADSDLVEKAEYRSGGDVILRTTRLIEDHRDLVDSVENKWVGSSGSTVVSKYDYTNDDIGRRTAVTRTGVAFPTTQPVAWAYNDRNELIEETRSDAGLTGEQLAKLHVAYRYDAIGNRTFEPAGEDRFVRVEGDLGDDEEDPGDDNPPHDEPAASTYYNVNALNQYERVERPYVPSEYDAVFPAFAQRLTYDADGNLSLVEKFGDANCDGVVNNFDIDDFVLAILSPDASFDVGPSPLQSAPPTGYSGDVACWNQRRVWGDVTGDGNLDNFDIDPFANVLLSSYEPVVCYKRFVWDAENRLSRVEPMNTPTTNGVERWVYVYDYMGRRVEKRKEVWSTSGTPHWATDSTIRLVYDGWNVIEELQDGGTGFQPVRKYTWGLDLSGLSGIAIDAERTFWEKATILHQQAHRVGVMPSRYSRHYYDMSRLAESPIRAAALADQKLLADVVEFKQRFYPSNWARYEDAKPGSFKLLPGNAHLSELRSDYQAMRQMIFGTAPNFDDIVTAIKRLEYEINQLPSVP